MSEELTRGYCTTLTAYQRRKSRVVNIGDVPLGGHHPIRVQSMTTTDTMDTAGTLAQSIRMIEAGCEYVRITAPSLNEAQNLQNIKDELKKRGYTTPLIADIHFTPNAAELAARIVEKVRINPGNYADKKKFETIEYNDNQYDNELERIRKKFTPLVKICKEYGTAMRIGTNHGSLSDRIMSRYGDSPLGMVESALEFLRIAEDENYYNIVLSMKSSNPIVMIEAYRLLVSRMESENMSYPLHLGVTEAGGEEEGRIKSALGISSLLADGLGDTIRVSLTEDPEFEIPVAKKIVAKYNQGFEVNNPIQLSWNNLPYHPFEYQRRHSKEVINIGGSNVPRVIADLSFLSANDISKETLSAIDHHYQPVTDKWHSGDLAVDYLYLGDTLSPFMLPNGTKAIYRYNTWLEANNPLHTYPLLSLEEFLSEDIDIPTAKFVEISALNINDDVFEAIKKDNSVIVFLTNEGAGEATFHQMRMWCILATQKGITAPIVFASDYSTTLDSEEFIIQSASDIGGLLADGFGDGLLFTYQPNTEILPLINRTSFNILQASRTRISKTEYISCPSCGRTLFDLQETTAMIRKETDHLKGVKIAIMGCIVNGPGEMADADFGYVGVGNQKITLYRGKEVVKKNIDSQFALQELINLIKENGYWIERN